MEERAQGAIEYLLIIGAAILVVVVVVLAVSGVFTAGKSSATATTGDYNRALTDLNNA